MTEEITREEATERLESIFNSNLEGEELEKMLENIPQRLDKFEGKWPKLIVWAEEKFGPAGDESGEDDAPSDEAEAEEPETATNEEWLILRQSIISDSKNPEHWKAIAGYFDARGQIGRANACLEEAEAQS